jgi:citrate lyase synthetase
LLCGPSEGFKGFGFHFWTVEEEIAFLEDAKENLENQLKNIESRLKKLRA